jgi:lactate permease
VLCAIFIYDLSVKTGDFEIVKRSIAGLAADRRIQLLIIGFSFGAFLEGAAGFGTPVAICAAMLIGLGFKPLPAAGLSLIGNTAPVAFGALGTPVVVLAAVTGLPLADLAATVGRQLTLFSLLVPFWLVAAMAGFKGMVEVWPACLAAGLSFTLAQLAISNLHGPWVVSIGSAIASILSMLLLLRFWQPKTIFRFEHDAAATEDRKQDSRSDVLRAWMPWALLSVFVFVWGLPDVKVFFNGGPKGSPNFLAGLSMFKWAVPLLDGAVLRNVPVVSAPKAEEAAFTFNWLSATGTSLLLAGALAGFLRKLSARELAVTFLGTLNRVKISLLTISAMLALGFNTRYAGLDATLGLAFASTGVLFPFFSPLLGWLGVALTGSDTSSNVLFGGLQQVTAKAIGVSPLLAAAANSAGGVMGKMIDAQSIVVAGTATGQQGGEGEILRFVFWHSIILAALVGVVVMLMAYVVPWMVPGVPMH